jgi:hypothetical protein
MDAVKGLSARLVPSLVLALGAIATAGCGQGAKGGCPALPACGGNPVGTWSLANDSDSCQFQPVRPAQTVDVTAFTGLTPPLPATIAPPQPNPVVAQQTTSGDWCSSLVYVEDPTPGVTNAVLWHDAPKLTAANITFGADFSYLSTLTFSTDPKTDDLPVTRNTTHFAPRCLLANGATSPTCDKLTTALTAFYAPQNPSAVEPAAFSQISCTGDAATTGCDCSYIFTVAVSDQGMWAVNGDTLLQDSEGFLYNGAAVDSQAPSTTLESSFCAEKSSLQLSGARGGSLFGVLGLRTMELGPTAAP